jgi:hypothetical protein
MSRSAWIFSLVSVIGFLFTSIAIARDDIREQRVQFEPGEATTTVDGTITGYEAVDYLLGARAGQTMSVTMTTDHGATYFNVLSFDSENEADFVGSSEGHSFIGRLDLDGDWKVRVSMMRSAARRGETAVFKMEIGISGSADPSLARERNDFGPREWDARGDLGCAVGGAPLQPGTCPFKVLRYESGGTVFVVPPGGGPVRVLYFESGTWTTDSAAQVKVSRRDDIWTLTVEGETYELPDAVLTGG